MAWPSLPITVRPPWWAVLIFDGAMWFFVAVILSVVFPIAHCEEHAAFPTLSETGDVPSSWAVHEVESTGDFARRSGVLTWYLVG